jgi:hypothetical protein
MRQNRFIVRRDDCDAPSDDIVSRSSDWNLGTRVRLALGFFNRNRSQTAAAVEIELARLGARRPCLQQPAIGADIVIGHSFGGKSFFETLPHRAAVVRQDLWQHRDGFFIAVDDFAGDAVVDDLGDRPATERKHRRAARHGFDHHKAKRLWPVHREQQSGRLAQEFCFLALVDLR